MAISAFPSELVQFVHDLVITGAWLDEVWVGITNELPVESHPGESLRDVVFEMLCGTIEPALERVDSRDLQRATEIINLAAARVEEHLSLGCDLANREHEGADGEGRSSG